MSPTTLAKSVDEAITGQKREMRILDPIEGDLKMCWDPENAEEVKSMREVFSEQKKKGMAAFRVDRKGKKAEQMNAFDPEADAIIFAPAPVGG